MKTANRWLYANKPNEISLKELERINREEKGEFIATKKIDGYRALLDYGESAECWSRRDRAKGGPTLHPIAPEIREGIGRFKEENNLPEGTRLDCEWRALRHVSIGKPQKLYIFGIYFLGEEWLGNEAEEDRWEIVSNFKYNDQVLLVESLENYVDLYLETKGDYTYEGIVLKDKTSKLITNSKACKKNPAWLKCKWRGGDNGMTLME